ncbi:Extra-cytoplasmic solute receptor (plasmid) [Roseomonas mucosa]|uniref:Bug family tripartite tricarboxylate transporter substrate binding protein n=1 Tax=Roseomonas mucosa TaxID=207340 RepID=UPI0022069111|nr:tripartite tricarboxylate transporter substrate binding protein [Roseomonas mucosa]QDJ11590.1 Extra-cytoplasmic solute receptor [Roseomonas mucosa]
MPYSLPRRALLGTTLALPMLARPALAQNSFPTRPLKLVVPFPPGGSTDVIGRIIAAALQEPLGQTVVVDNRPGASGIIGSSAVARSPADGYTLLFSNVASQGVMPGLAPNRVDYNLLDDFTHIGMIGVYWAVLLVNPGFPVKDLSGFIAEAKRSPGVIDFATSGIGSTPHLIGEMLKLETGIDITHVAYRGSGPALTAVIANEVPCMIDSMPSASAHLRSGALRGLAVSSGTRIAAFPDLPTFKEQGFPKLAVDNWYGISGPAGMPADATQRVASALALVLSKPDLQERFRGIGLEAKTMSGAPFRQFIGDQAKMWAETIHAAGIKPE